MDEKNGLRILLVEDNELDRGLIETALDRAKLDYSMAFVDTRAEFIQQLDTFRPDIVLCDFSLPQFGAIEALGIVEKFDPHLPVVVVTGTLTDETAVECLKKGAVDYVLKEKVVRLPLAIANALQIKRAKKAKDEYENHLKTARDEANAANQAKTQFLANMSHEMRTPLSAISGLTELLLLPNQDPNDRILWIEKIGRNAETLRTMIDEILDLSKVEAGKLNVRRQLFAITGTIAQVKSILYPLAKKKGLELRFELTGAIPESIYSDSIKLRHILINIMGNAIKFSDSGVITLQIKMDDENHLALTVRDQGRGIPPDHIKNLFQPFVQVDNSMTRQFGGTGLGLTLARRFAQALGGDVVLTESTLGQGSTFKIMIQTDHPKETKMIESLNTMFKPSISVIQDVTGSVALNGLKILLVEDAPENQFLVKRFLEMAGAHVDIAGEGQEGVQKAMSADYDVILMDIQMPVLDGYHATTRLRQKGYTKPIVALTAHAFEGEKERCLKSGFDNFLTKPIKRAELLSQVAKYTHAAAS